MKALTIYTIPHNKCSSLVLPTGQFPSTIQSLLGRNSHLHFLLTLIIKRCSIKCLQPVFCSFLGINFPSFSCQSSRKYKLVIHQASKICCSQMNLPQINFMELHLEFTFCQKCTVCIFSETSTNCIEVVSLRTIQLMQLETTFVRFILIKMYL